VRAYIVQQALAAKLSLFEMQELDSYAALDQWVQEARAHPLHYRLSLIFINTTTSARADHGRMAGDILTEASKEKLDAEQSKRYKERGYLVSHAACPTQF